MTKVEKCPTCSGDVIIRHGDSDSMFYEPIGSDKTERELHTAKQTITTLLQQMQAIDALLADGELGMAGEITHQALRTPKP